MNTITNTASELHYRTITITSTGFGHVPRSTWTTRLGLSLRSRCLAKLNVVLCGLLMAASVTAAEESQVGTSGLVVKDREGKILLTDAAYRGLSGTRLVFQSGLDRHQYFPVRDLDPALLARLKLDPQQVEEQAAQAAQRGAVLDRACAAQRQAIAERRAKEAGQAAAFASARAAEFAERQQAAQEESRRDMAAWAMYEQANATMTAANAALIQAARGGSSPGVIVQNQAVSSAVNQVVGPWLAGPPHPIFHTPSDANRIAPGRTGTVAPSPRSFAPARPISSRPTLARPAPTRPVPAHGSPAKARR